MNDSEGARANGSSRLSKLGSTVKWGRDKWIQSIGLVTWVLLVVVGCGDGGVGFWPIFGRRLTLTLGVLCSDYWFWLQKFVQSRDTPPSDYKSACPDVIIN